LQPAKHRTFYLLTIFTPEWTIQKMTLTMLLHDAKFSHDAVRCSTGLQTTEEVGHCKKNFADLSWAGKMKEGIVARLKGCFIFVLGGQPCHPHSGGIHGAPSPHDVTYSSIQLLAGRGGEISPLRWISAPNRPTGHARKAGSCYHALLSSPIASCEKDLQQLVHHLCKESDIVLAILYLEAIRLMCFFAASLALIAG
jgi:hypothetical protein